MSPPGRPKGEYRSAQHEGRPVSPGAAADSAANGSVLYVYYKVPEDRHAALADEVARFQVALQQAWPGLVCELLQRPQASDGIETWMETYRHPGAALPALMASIAQAAAQAGLPAPRHAEVFVPLGTPP